MTEHCQKELNAVKKASSAKSRNHSVERYQKCLINATDNHAKTGYHLNKKEKEKLKEGKKI